MHFISYFSTTPPYSLFPNEVVSSSTFSEVPVVHMGQFQFIFPVSTGMHSAESWTLLKWMTKLILLIMLFILVTPFLSVSLSLLLLVWRCFNKCHWRLFSWS